MEPPAKRKAARFLFSWTLPPGITASSNGPSFATVNSARTTSACHMAVAMT